VDAAVRANALHVAAEIRESAPVFEALASEGVEVAAAYYDLASGRVEWLQR